MKIVLTALGCIAAAALFGIAGCREHRVVVHERRPVVVEEHRVVDEGPDRVIIVREAPPREIVEVRPAPPSSDFVWVFGYHRWDGRRYVWVGGRWDRPPHRGAVWVRHQYIRVHDHDRNGWEYHPGHWR